MTTVDLGTDGLFRFVLDGAEDVASLGVALKAVDGADQIELKQGADLSMDLENPFNAFALWLAGFDMSHSALRSVLDTIAPLAWAHMGIHSRGFQKFSMRRIKEMRASKDPRPGDPDYS